MKAHKASMRKRLSAELSELRAIAERAEAATTTASVTNSEQLRTESDRFMKKSEELNESGPIFI